MNGKQTNTSSQPGNDTMTPVFYSVVVYPGVGQWMQKRRNAGTFYFAVFTVLGLLFCWLLFSYLLQVVPIIRAALQGESVVGREIPPLKVVIYPFGAVLFVYVANIIDVLRGRLQLKKAAAVNKDDGAA